MLAAGQDRFDLSDRLVGDAPVLLRQEFHCEMNAGEVAPLDLEIARLFRPAGQQHGVEFAIEFLCALVDADMGAVVENHPFRFHLCDAAIDVVFFHLEVRDAVTQQATGLGLTLEHMDLMAAPRELLGGGQSGLTRADNGDLLPGPG